MKTSALLCILLLLCLAMTAQKIINVPENHGSIQSAIDHAEDGDFILVDTGTYFENINFRGKAITVASKYFIDQIESYRTNTIINGSMAVDQDSASVVSFTSGEDNNSVLYGFTITGGKGTYSTYEITGGGIYIYNSWPKISHNIIEGNTIENSHILIYHCTGSGIGGFYNYDVEETKVLHIDHNTISNNEIITEQYHAFGAGIGITSLALKDSSNAVILSSNTIKGNHARTLDDNSYGGGLYIQNMQAYLIHNYIENNTANGYTGSFGGGIAFIDDNSFQTYQISLEQNYISANQSLGGDESYGGGVFIRGGTLDMTKNTVENNSLTREGFVKQGGGLCLKRLERPGKIGYNEFLRNNAISGKGGAICALSEEMQYLTIEGNIFAYDSASIGGGMRAENCNISFYNNVFKHNHAQQGGALSVCGNGSSTNEHAYRLLNNTFSHNRASYNGGALYTSYNNPVLVNNIFFADEAIRGKEIFSPLSGLVEIAYTNIDVNDIDGQYYDGFGLFEQDPSFCDSLGYDCMISCTSPCVNSGVEEYVSYITGVTFRCPEYDILMNPRPLGGAIDIGAFELFPFAVEEESGHHSIIMSVHPNPVNDYLWLDFEIPEASQVSIEFYNMAGSRVLCLARQAEPYLQQTLKIDLGSLTSGVYFCRLVSSKASATKKIIKE